MKLVLASNNAKKLAELGALFAPLSWRLAPPEHRAMLADCRPRVLVVDDDPVLRALGIADAQGRADNVDSEIAARITAALGGLEQRKRELEVQIDDLRAFEREYRTRLKAYLEAQLSELGRGAPDDAGAGVPAAAYPLVINAVAGQVVNTPTANQGSRDIFRQDGKNYAIFTHDIFKITDRLSLRGEARALFVKLKYPTTFQDEPAAAAALQLHRVDFAEAADILGGARKQHKPFVLFQRGRGHGDR